ncbi:MAG: site-specific DNA-methyltransferase [Paraclostridium sp.]
MFQEVSFDTHTLFIGDNLEVMQHILPQYKSSIKCIYIDPPYNTGKTSFIFKDNLGSDWSNMIKERLTLAKEFLTFDGIIFISIDDHSSHILRCIMDTIFGRQNYVGTLIRKTKSSTNDIKVGFNIQHEECIVYAKDKKQVTLVGEEKDFAAYKNSDSNGFFTYSNPSAPKRLLCSSCYFPITNPYTGKTDYPPKNREWRFSEETYKKYIDNGTIVFKTNHKPNERGFYFKGYKSQLKSQYNPVNSLCFATNDYLNQVGTKELQKMNLPVHFSYPKPVNFIKKIIQYSTKKDSLVFDFFAGSGTTGQAILELNKEDGGTRKFILIESQDHIADIIKKRLSDI